MAITSSEEMKAALQGGLRHYCPVCRSHDLIVERLDTVSAVQAQQDAGCVNCSATWTIVYEFSEILNLKSDDRKLGPDQLREKYDGAQGTAWGQHPDHPMQDWRREVANGDTRTGYWEWAMHRISEAQADA